MGLIGGVGIVRTPKTATGGNDVFTFTAPLGTKFTAAGCENHSENMKVLYSYPSSDGTMWTFQATSNGLVGATFDFWFSAVNTGIL